MSFHDERCLCTQCEVAREQRSHDSEIDRIADALNLLGGTTVEDIITEIRRLRAVEKEVGL